MTDRLTRGLQCTCRMQPFPRSVWQRRWKSRRVWLVSVGFISWYRWFINVSQDRIFCCLCLFITCWLLAGVLLVGCLWLFITCGFPKIVNQKSTIIDNYEPLRTIINHYDMNHCKSRMVVIMVTLSTNITILNHCEVLSTDNMSMAGIWLPL